MNAGATSKNKWINSLGTKILAIITTLGIIFALLSDGSDILEKFFSSSQKSIDSLKTVPIEKEGFRGHEKLVRSNDTSLKSSPPMLKKGIQLVQFAVNSDLCFFKEDKVEKSILYVSPIDFLEDTLTNIEIQIAENNNVENQRFNRRKYFPIFDVTFMNDSNDKTILTDIKLHVFDFEMPEGDGSVGGGLSRPIELINRYELVIPDLYDLYVKYLDDGTRIKKKYEFIKNYPAIPPILMEPNDPARIQLLLANKASSGAVYDILLEFIFSDGQVIQKKLNLDF